MGNDVAAREAARAAGALARRWARSTGRGSRTTRPPSPRSRWRSARSRINRAPRGSSPSSIACPGPTAYAKAIAEHRTLVAARGDRRRRWRPISRPCCACSSRSARSTRRTRRRRCWWARDRPITTSGAVPAVPAARRDPRARAADRGAVAAPPLSPRRGPGLSQMLATLCPALASARAKLPKDMRLKKKHQRNVLTDPSVVCKAFAYGCQVFGMPAARRLPGARVAGRPRRRQRPRRGPRPADAGDRTQAVRDRVGRRAGVHRRPDAGRHPPRSPAALAELRAHAGRAGDRGARGDPAGRPGAPDPAGGRRRRSSSTRPS